MTNQKQQTGQSLAEFALILPILLAITFGILDFGRVLFTFSLGASSMRDAVRYANLLGYEGGTPAYQDCDAIEAQLTGGLNDIFLNLDPNTDDIVIEYFQTNDLGSSFDDDVTDPLSSATPVADCDETDNTYPSPTNTSSAFQNGDIMRITISTRVPFVTPFLNTIFGDTTLNFVGQRSIVTRLEFSDDPNDSDYDGLSDDWEIQEFGSIQCYEGTDDGDSGGHTVQDADGNNVTCPGIDGDGCDLLCEAFNGSDPEDSDSDEDGLTDGVEANESDTNLMDPDTDGDGRTDAEEHLGYQPAPAAPDGDNKAPEGRTTAYPEKNIITINVNGQDIQFRDDQNTALKTDPLNPDTDDDGYGDGQELGEGQYSAVSTTHPASVMGDILVNGERRTGIFRLDPTKPDTDGDGWMDGTELDDTNPRTVTLNIDGENRTIELLTDPTHNDTDGDGLFDGAASGQYNELKHGTSPIDNDTDNDGYPDGNEVRGANPDAVWPFQPGDYGIVLPVVNNDTDVPVSQSELISGLNPTDSDSDDDGLLDGFEVRTDGSANPYVTNPTNPDTDGDSSPEVLTAYGLPDTAQALFTDGAEMNRQSQAAGSTQSFASDPTSRQTLTDNDDAPATSWGDNNSDGITDVAADPANDMPPEDDRSSTGFDIPDSFEFITFGSNPGVGDTDGDGLNDWEENYFYCSYNDGGTRIPTDPLDPDEPFVGGLGSNDRNTLDECGDSSQDTDDDGLPDWWELQYFGDLDENASGDVDTQNLYGATDDGCDNLCEFRRGTDPTDGDSDVDGLLDGAEIFTHGTDPNALDTDNDRIDDEEEVNNSNTNPTNPDTDGDGLLDGDEYLGINSYQYGDFATGDIQTARLVGYSEPDIILEAGAVKLNPNDPDSDNDGFPDGMEAYRETLTPQLQGVQIESTQYDIDNNGRNPFFIVALRPDHPDSDGDGIPDQVEARYGTYPHLADTDKDGLEDNAERLQHSTNPIHPDTDEDGVDDGDEATGFGGNEVTFPNLDNVIMSPWSDVETDPSLPGINPNNPDTDGDNIPDGVELQQTGIDLEIQDRNGNDVPYNYMTYPHSLDSDDDCLSDYEEVVNADSSDPTDSADFSGNGCGDLENAPPEAVIIFSVGGDCTDRENLPSLCQFDEASSDTDDDQVVEWEWDIISNTTGVTVDPADFDPDREDQTPSYILDNYGEYTVRLRVRDDHPSNPLWSDWATQSFILTENDPPKAQIVFDLEECATGTVPIVCPFVSQVSPEEGETLADFTYEWRVPDDNGTFNPNNNNRGSDSASPEYAFTGYGTYTVELRVQDDHPDYPLWSTWTSVTITLEPPPVDSDGDWMYDYDEENIYMTDPNESDLDHIQNTYPNNERTEFDAFIQHYLQQGTIPADASNYTTVNGNEVLLTVISVNKPTGIGDEQTWANYVRDNYGITIETTGSQGQRYSVRGYVTGEELVKITLEDLKQRPNEKIGEISWQP